MRDLLLLVLLTGGCAWTLREPWIGTVIWAVVSLGVPHQQFGYAAAHWPVAAAVGGCTLIGMLLTRERQNPFGNGAVLATLGLSLWMSFALPFSLEPDLSYDMWDRSIKISVMLFVTLVLINTRKKLDVFIWANVVAIGYYGVKGGLFAIKSGGQYSVVGPGGFIGGNNELALAEIVVLPFLRYLQLQASHKWLRRGLGVSMGLIAMSIIVSHSRGALVGMLAMVTFFWFKNNNKLLWGPLIIVGALVGMSSMPDEWWNRMDTIQDYETDSSAQGRINSWWLAWNIATERITGGGFRLTVPWIFARYAPNPRLIFVAHSIYFQMLGEQGFIGLILFLSIGVLTWFNASRMIWKGKADPAKRWAADLGSMIHVSMIGFGVTGAFLSLAYFDLPYNVMVISALGLHFAAQGLEAQPSPGAAAPDGGVPEPSSTGGLAGQPKRLSR